MDKQRILITEQDAALADRLVKCLAENFDVIVRQDGMDILDAIHTFDPDLLIFDLYLSKCEAIDLLNTIRASGNTVEVIALTRNITDRISSAMENLGVFQLVRKPYSIDHMLACVYAALQNKNRWNCDLELYSILGSLGFYLGIQRTQYIADGILMWYHSEGKISTKQLYFELADIHGKSATGIEKAIRDAIHHAWVRGNQKLWAMYFCEQNTLHQRCPSNEVFIARMAHCLWTKQKFKLHYKKAE